MRPWEAGGYRAPLRVKPGRTSLVTGAWLVALFVQRPDGRVLLAAQDASTPEEIEITVGADGLGVVREVRSAQLVAGESTLRVFDVSPQLLPESVAMRALGGPDLVELRQQSAWFEVLDVARALDSLSGRPARLIRFHETEVERLEGRLLFPPVVPGPNGLVPLPLYLEQSDGHIRLIEGAEIELDSIPSGDWNRFRLDWRLSCKRPDRYRFELVYVTRGLSWRSDVSLRVAADGATGDVSAFATIENRTGVTWRGAKLAVAEEDAPVPWARRAEPGDRPSPLFHPVAEGVTVEANAPVQFALAQVRDLPLRIAPSVWIDRGIDRTGAADRARAAVVRRFEVQEGVARGLGRALPSGTARVVVVDAKNRPFLASTRPFAATGPGAPLSFYGDPVPGVFATTTVSPAETRGERGDRVLVSLWSERDDSIQVDALCPLAIAETVEEPSVQPDRATPGVARFSVPLGPHGRATIEFNIARP